jgi:hypothetical protein
MINWCKDTVIVLIVQGFKQVHQNGLINVC